MFAPWRSQSSFRKHGCPITGNSFIANWFVKLPPFEMSMLFALLWQTTEAPLSSESEEKFLSNRLNQWLDLSWSLLVRRVSEYRVQTSRWVQCFRLFRLFRDYDYDDVLKTSQCKASCRATLADVRISSFAWLWTSKRAGSDSSETHAVLSSREPTQNKGTRDGGLLCLTWDKVVARGVLPEKSGGSVRPASQNPYPIYDQNLRYSLPYLWADQKFETLFMT